MGQTRRCGELALLALVGALVAASPATAAGPLVSQWYSDTGLTDLVRTESDSIINFAWPQGTGPDGLPDSFSARWTGSIEPSYSEDYTFIVTRDDGVRLWIGDTLILEDDWTVGHTGEVASTPIALEADTRYPLRLEFVDGYGDAEVRLAWESASQNEQIVSASQLHEPLSPPPGPDPPPALVEDPIGDPMPGAAVAEPSAGTLLNISEEGGTVVVRLPNGQLVQLGELDELPVGSVVDARRGTARLVAEGPAGSEQSVNAWGAIFRVNQKRDGKRLVTMGLSHPAGWCRTSPSAGGSANASQTTRSTRLWAKGKGNFRTRGNRSAATVRGTTWSVEDRCGSTVTRVREGTVAVRDFARRKTVLVSAGKRYVAKGRRR